MDNKYRDTRFCPFRWFTQSREISTKTNRKMIDQLFVYCNFLLFFFISFCFIWFVYVFLFYFDRGEYFLIFVFFLVTLHNSFFVANHCVANFFFHLKETKQKKKRLSLIICIHVHVHERPSACRKDRQYMFLCSFSLFYYCQ